MITNTTRDQMYVEPKNSPIQADEIEQILERWDRQFCCAPVHLVTLVQCHAWPEGPTSEGAAQELVAQGLADRVLEAGSHRWNLTERGLKWLDMLLQTPLPEQAWVDPRATKKLE